jgi:hypothetical protein
MRMASLKRLILASRSALMLKPADDKIARPRRHPLRYLNLAGTLLAVSDRSAAAALDLKQAPATAHVGAQSDAN